MVHRYWTEDKTYAIPLEQCEDGWLYHIDARNGQVGVYIAKLRGFNLSRHKFGDNFIDFEYHWDTGAPHGTAHALRKLEIPPDLGWGLPATEDNHRKQLAYLNDAYARLGIKLQDHKDYLAKYVGKKIPAWLDQRWTEYFGEYGDELREWLKHEPEYYL